jgi:hypothetical protein
MGQVCRTEREGGNVYRILVRNREGERYLGDTVVHERIMLTVS